MEELMCSKEHAGTRRKFLTVAATGAASVAALGSMVVATRAETTDPSKADQIIQDWPETAKKSAQAMIEKYGPPSEATQSMLLWQKNGPWKRTIVNKEEVDHDFPMPHKDVMEQFVNYKVPPEKFDELAKYDGSVIVERTKGELSARCDKEEANFLALNLANDIVKGEKSVEEAREFYGESIKKFMAGEKPEYMQKLLFEVQQKDAGDPDVSTIKAG
jgi:hypothetical protein